MNWALAFHLFSWPKKNIPSRLLRTFKRASLTLLVFRSLSKACSCSQNGQALVPALPLQHIPQKEEIIFCETKKIGKF
jgi:hypothetical protein